MSGGMLNLSLLSRGVGEVHTNGHEKVDVYLEPEDYLNFSTNQDKCYLPSIQSKHPLTHADPRTHADNPTITTSRDMHKFRVPKTYSTRKGALLLFSEDLAQRNTAASIEVSDTHRANISTNGLHSQVSLKTVEDLANSILKYGSQGHLNDNIYLKFVRAHCGTFERQFRPGFSAKRYLSTWTRTWDDSVFGNIIRNGYLAEPSLYQHTQGVPNLRRRFMFDDLSRMPEPYRLMRSMLMTPESLSGYTFYSQNFEEREDQSQSADIVVLERKSDKLQNIKVVKTKGKVQKEVCYSDLDIESQKEVITDLLVKSAVHYAVRKHEEVYKDWIIRAMRNDHDVELEEEGEGTVSSAIQEFDMREAVESLLDSQHVRLAESAQLDDGGRSSEGTLSFRGVAVSSNVAKHTAAHNSGWYGDGSEDETEYTGGGLPSPRSDSSSSTTGLSSFPVLPHIRVALSPIRDTSREASQVISLPPLVQGTRFKDQHSEHTSSHETSQTGPTTSSHETSQTGPTTSSPVPGTSDAQATRGLTSPDIDALSELGEDATEAGREGTSTKQVGITSSIIQGLDMDTDNVAAAKSSHKTSNMDILKSTAGFTKSQATWKMSEWRKGDLITDKAAIAENSLEESMTAGLFLKSNGNKKPSRKEAMSQGLNVTENDIMDMLASHARQVAESVLNHPSAGSDLGTDVKLAANLWSKIHTSRSPQPANRVGEFGSGVIDEITASRPASSGASSVDEYKSLIRRSLTMAVSKATGLEPDVGGEDAEISSQLLDALANHMVSPDQIEIVTDGQGHARIQAKEQQGDGEIGRRQISIPDGSMVLDEDVDHGQSQGWSQEATARATDQKVTSPKVKRSQNDPDNLPESVSKVKAADASMSVRSGSTAGPQKTGTSKDSKKKSKNLEEKEDPFVVGMPKEKKQPTAQQPPQKEAKKVKSKKKEVKGKKKAEKKSLRQKVVKTKSEKLAVEKQEEASDIHRQLPPQRESSDIYQSRMSSPGMKSEGSELEFSFVREQSGSEHGEHEDNEDDMQTEEVPLAKLQVSSPGLDYDEDKLDSESGDDGEASKLKSISNREARAAKRAAAAAKRREEVEHRRRLKEEQVKREKEEAERQIELQKEMEEQRKRVEEDRRLRKQQKVEEDEREKMEADEVERRQKLEAEREKRAKEEFQRKLEEMRRKQQEEEMRKRELMLLKQKEEEERRAAEELMLSKMEKHERMQYERIKREEEEERRRKELEDNLRRAEEAHAAMEEARRLTQEMSRKQAELESRLQFNRSLQDEASRLSHAHTINRAFVFSYYELLQWLGLDIPEFELAKLAE